MWLLSVMFTGMIPGVPGADNLAPAIMWVMLDNLTSFSVLYICNPFPSKTVSRPACDPIGADSHSIA